MYWVKLLVGSLLGLLRFLFCRVLLVRLVPLDPMKQPTINNTLQIPGIYKRRVGRPRLGLVSENCKWIYKKQFHENYDEHNPEHVQKLIKEAKDRKFWPIGIKYVIASPTPVRARGLYYRTNQLKWVAFSRKSHIHSAFITHRMHLGVALRLGQDAWLAAMLPFAVR